MYIVTGAAGFIGSEIIKALNRDGIDDIIAVDAIGVNDERYKNLCDLQVADYYDRSEFYQLITESCFEKNIDVIFHQGACSDTMETDGGYMLENNFTFSKAVLHFALENKAPLVYASSAATYGASTTFVEEPANECPLNVYGYSKLVFDQYVRKIMPTAESTIVGLRYFNVYGVREAYKGRMSSMVYQLHKQLKNTGTAKLFKGTGGYADGGQERDFVYVGDVVKVNRFFAKTKGVRGIVNCGTGNARSFNDIASTIINIIGNGKIEYIPIPDSIAHKYQNFTQANLTNLRALGYKDEFATLEQGIAECIDQWNK